MTSLRRRVVVLAVIVATSDQLTKVLVRHFLSPCLHTPSSLCAQLRIGSSLTIINTQNRGSAFGYSQGLWIWTLLALAGLLLAWAMGRRSGASRASLFAVGLLVGGAAGNLIDRIIRGSVTDLFGFRWGVRGGVVINLADIALAAGAALAGKLAWTQKVTAGFSPEASIFMTD